MLAVLPSMWNRYHGWCRCQVVRRAAVGAEVVVEGEAAPPLAWHLVSAELGKACELAGASAVTVVTAPGATDRRHTFTITWSSEAVAAPA